LSNLLTLAHLLSPYPFTYGEFSLVTRHGSLLPGAISYFLPKLDCPMFCTEYTANMIRANLGPELEAQANFVIVKPGEPFAAGPFDLHLQPMCHSIPEANAIVLDTE